MPPLQAACIAFVLAAFGDPVDVERLDRKGEYIKLSEATRSLMLGDNSYQGLFDAPYFRQKAVPWLTRAVLIKADQMRGTNPGNLQNFYDIFRTLDNANKSIKGFLFRDGPRGLNLMAELPAGKDGFATAFPVPMARSTRLPQASSSSQLNALSSESIWARCVTGANRSAGAPPTRWVGLSGVISSGNSASRVCSSLTMTS